MPRTNRPPAYRHHKARNLAVVTIDGKDHYLGDYGSPESHEKYARLIAEWRVSGNARPLDTGMQAETANPTVNEVILAYWRHCEQHYRTLEGTPTGELDNIRLALRPLRRLYGGSPARDFGPLALRSVREEMVRSGLARTTVNSRLHKVRRVFKWAAGVELVPVGVYQGLLAVEGLRKGRSAAPEPPPVLPVTAEAVDATLPHMPAPVAAMARLQLLTACRAGEVMAMRAFGLDTSGQVWIYRPFGHKNQHRGLDRVIFLGPQAQDVLLPFLRVTCPSCGLTDRAYRLAWRSGLCGPCADRHDELGVCGPWPRIVPCDDYHLFSPRDHVEDLRARRAAQRESKRTPSELSKKRKAAPRRTAADRYNRRSYRLAVVRACCKAGIPPWSPLQLRHAAATAIRAMYGVEAAKVILGHTRVETSQIYAERDLAAAVKIMREIG